MAEAAESKCSREELSLKKSTIQQHVASSKHKAGKEKLAKKKKREINITQALKKYNDHVHPSGEAVRLGPLGDIVKGSNYIKKNESSDQ